MLKEERQKLILDRLNSSKKVNFGELEKILNVSYDSIRRDVIELEDKGLLKKVHGGIVANSYYKGISESAGKFQGSDELGIIVKKAIKLFENNQLVLMDGGSTNFHIASQLPKNISTTIITNSPPLAVALNQHSNLEVILLGGQYFKKYQISLGTAVMDQLNNFKPDLYFMGVNGIHIDNGLTVRNYEETMQKKKMMSISKNVVACTIEEKINHSENFKICNVDEIDVLVTNLSAKHKLLSDFESLTLSII
ncbi:DNA-binding transcriptional regulator of sugar metabolism, DeoR/GlpR family [Spirosomataceae bacterium TFI 002]|nr:DNA-binding transcriptional regulator of sugar metabolism, DeoR/GlpR family [Spirosomataceae bacterium TFI 002]